MEIRPVQAEVQGARQSPEGERLRGAGGKRERDRGRKEIKTKGPESQQKGSPGDEGSSTDHGHRQIGCGRRCAERWRKQRAEGPQGTESRVLHQAWQRRSLLKGTQGHPHSHVRLQVHTSSLLPSLGSRAQLPASLLRGSAPNAPLILGLPLRGTDPEPAASWPLAPQDSPSSPHRPLVQPPCLPAVPASQ